MGTVSTGNLRKHGSAYVTTSISRTWLKKIVKSAVQLSTSANVIEYIWLSIFFCCIIARWGLYFTFTSFPQSLPWNTGGHFHVSANYTFPILTMQTLFGLGLGLWLGLTTGLQLDGQEHLPRAASTRDYYRKVILQIKYFQLSLNFD